MRRFHHQLKNSISLSVVILSVFLISISGFSLALPVQADQAQKAAGSWLERNQQPMGRSIGRLVDRAAEAETIVDDAGNPLCYIHHLSPDGFVITSADDEIEPIIAFSATGHFESSPDSPLTALLKKDMSQRQAAIQKQAVQSIRHQKKRLKWQLFTGDNLAGGGEEFAQIESTASISDVWVDPFLQVLWDQGNVAGSPCYNYYTPSNYVTGCVATAMAQIMRYHSFPTTGIGVNAFTIEVDGDSQTAYTRGGNGSGGPYNWAQMIYDPQSGVTPVQREAIGALCYDAGAAVKMSYTSDDGSSAFLNDADEALTDTFNYANSVYTYSISSSGDVRLWNAVNANLDAQLPMILGIDGPAGGHAVVADGYGYNGETLYHHINMGWGGRENAWYQLPLIDAGDYIFTVIDSCIYNIYPSGTGEIISGRVTNLAGAPLSGVTVTASRSGVSPTLTTTNSRGVYALEHLSSNRTYTVSAAKSGENFLPQSVTTGTSTDRSTPGNRSGILFVSANAGPPTAFDVEVDVDSTAIADIQLQVLDDGQPDPNLMEYVITSLPQHGDLSEPNVGPIDTIPYVLQAEDPNGVHYTPCPYFGGQDTFTYKANDGGTYPTGGDSNNATVTVNVSNQLFVDFGIDSSAYSSSLLSTSSYYDVRSQIIMLQSDIGSAQRLTDLAIKVRTNPGRTLNNWTIRMQHTNWTYYPDTYDVTEMFLPSGWTVVYQANETFSQTGWVNFHFDVPFEYNGSQNLLIDLSFNNSGRTSPNGTYYVETAAGDTRLISLLSSSGTHGDPLGWDFWALGGNYFIGSIPSMKLIGEPLIDPLAGDFDATCDVKLPDLAIFSQAWQTSLGNADYNPDCDLTPDKGMINLQDLIILSDQWFETYP